MRKSDENFSISLFGYDRNEVKSELEKVREEYKAKIDLVISQIQKAKEENEFLTRKYNDLKTETDSEELNLDILNYAYKKAEKYTALTMDAAEQETSKALKLGLDSEKLFNKKIEEFSNQIKETQKMLNELSDAIIKNNEAIDSNLQQFIKEKYSIFNLVTKNSKLKVKDTNIEKIQNTDASLIKEINSNINVINNTFKSISDDMNSKNEDTKEKIGCDNNIIKEVDHKTAETGNNSKNSEEKLPIENQVIQFKDIKIVNNDQKESNDTNKAAKSNKSSIRNKYLIGKVAGENLLDDNGNIIVSRGTIITEECVLKAEQLGKLAELIVNMTIPEISS